MFAKIYEASGAFSLFSVKSVYGVEGGFLGVVL